jgi:hypothetical protein
MRFAVWKWRRIGWKNVCKLWLEERTPEQLKGEVFKKDFMNSAVGTASKNLLGKREAF